MNRNTGHQSEKPSGGRRLVRFVTNILLFLASPFIALSYLVALPVVGLFQFTRSAMQSRKQPDSDKTPQAGQE